jgi:ABC-type transport system substrate-binding protein
MKSRYVVIGVGSVLVVVLLVGLLQLLSGDEGSSAGDGGPTPLEGSAVQRARGGVVRVGVSSPPELSDLGDGGDALRQLVYPSLFVAQPDGSWHAGIAQPGSDRFAGNGLSASFRLRSGVTWSDGTAVTVDDLRRTADKRFVASVDAKANGEITVEFTQRFPGWHRLWSGSDAISPPRDSLYGGPYVVQSLVSGLETDLVRNDNWWGVQAGAFLDEIDLVLVPDAATARELLARGQLDVLAPVEDTVRTQQLRALRGVNVATAEKGGKWAALRVSNTHVSDQVRPSLLSAFPRREFVRSLLDGEATPVEGLTGDDDHTWQEVPAGSAVQNATVRMSSLSSYPLTNLLDRTFQRAAQKAGAQVTVKDGDVAQMRDWLKSNDFDVMLELEQDGPDICWTCHFADVDAGLASRADSGDIQAAVQLQTLLRDRSLLLPLYRPITVVASTTDSVSGVEANGYAPSMTWNAATWWKPK